MVRKQWASSLLVLFYFMPGSRLVEINWAYSKINEATVGGSCEGDVNGRIFHRVEDFGRTFTLGVMGRC